MRKFKKVLALTLVASMLLPNGVMAKEIAPTVGGNKATTQAVEQETPPTTTKETPVSIPTTVPSTIEAVTETQSTEATTEQVVTKEETPAKTVPSTDATDKVDDKIKDVELDTVKESNETERITKDLLIKADEKSEIPSNGKVLSSHDNMYLVSFDTEDDAKKVYEDEKIDASLNTPFGIATGNEKSSDSVEPDVLDNLEEVIKDDDKKDDSFKITEEDYSIAVIDTGMPKGEKNIEFVSMLDDEGYDDHGHGALMLQSIREQDKDAKILSIKALDKNGYGDAATIYAALKYAIERKVDVINLSISGYATEGNKIIEDVIKEAVASGIIVVGAAGNDNLPASAFIPGGIDEIIVVGACNEKNERKSFSNYGITVDYYANANSTSQASATVAGAISVNKGDISKLDDKFFKTPDLSIFDEDLKNYRNPSEDEDTYGFDINYDNEDGYPEIENITDEEYLLRRLYQFVTLGGFQVAANAEQHKVKKPKADIRTAYQNGTYFVVDKDLIDPANVTITGTGQNSGWAPESMAFKYNTTNCTSTSFDGVEEGLCAVYKRPNAIATDYTVPAADDCVITIKNCVRCNTDPANTYDWVIKITDATFKWGNTDASNVKKNRKYLVAVYFPPRDVNKNTGDLPEFTTGAAFDARTAPNGNYKVDSANEFNFEMSVLGAPAGSVLLTGFSDLDQWQLYPVGQLLLDSNGNPAKDANGHNIILEKKDRGLSYARTFDERIDILDTTKLATKDYWVYNDCELSLSDQGSGVRAHSIQYQQPTKTAGATDTNGTILFAVNAQGGTPLHWNGCRCQTNIGLTMKNTVEKSNCSTYVQTMDADGIYRNRTLIDGPVQGYPGETYSFTYAGQGPVGPYHDINLASPATISAPYTLNDQVFDIYVPRVSFTYTFVENPPTGHNASEVTNMPVWNGAHSFTKLAENRAGEDPGIPKLKGYSFVGWFDTSAATGGNQYNANESMVSNKTFYARWEPMKYYVRYNGNGTTNFNENATNGMQAGEYHQNTVTGSTAYQIFTYDSTGEALRQNGFTRRGYDFVCWNTTSTRTGTDYNPGYVKPANVNWVKGDGTDPTATLDGTHNYPVVDLYAVWRQKLGTETLTVVSEETGNPVPNVTVKLTNTSNNNQVTTGTTNAQGKVTVNNLHWFPYKWSSTSVPAGYKAMQDVTFSINPANTNDDSFLTVNNERILYMKHVSLKINSKVSDIIDGENAPAFMYHITGTDVAGVTHSYDVMVQIDAESETGYNVVPVATNGEEPYMFAGNYTITQYDVSRYIAGNAENISNTTPVGKNATANLTNNDFAEVLFPYTIKQYGGFSGVHSLINKLTK